MINLGGPLSNQDYEPIEMEEPASTRGTTTVAPDVLLTIARLTALHVDGVSRMGSLPPAVNRIFQRGAGDGVSIEIKEDVVTIDLFVVLKQDVNIRDVSRTIQHDVARAISEMVGMQTGRVNIHIEDIDYSPEKIQERISEA